MALRQSQILANHPRDIAGIRLRFPILQYDASSGTMRRAVRLASPRRAPPAPVAPARAAAATLP
jgi:hypothetical protein